MRVLQGVRWGQGLRPYREYAGTNIIARFSVLVKEIPEKVGADAEGGNPRTSPGQMTPEGHFLGRETVIHENRAQLVHLPRQVSNGICGRAYISRTRVGNIGDYSDCVVARSAA